MFAQIIWLKFSNYGICYFLHSIERDQYHALRDGETVHDFLTMYEIGQLMGGN